MFGSDEFKSIVFKDGKLQLLLKLMGAERIGERGIVPRFRGSLFQMIPNPFGSSRLPSPPRSWTTISAF
jgi:hypothetical protein